MDLIVDVCAAIDQKTGGNIQKVLAKLNDMGTRLTQFLSGEGGVGGSGGAGSNPGGGSGGGDEGDYIAGVGDNAGGDGGLESGENGGQGGIGGDSESAREGDGADGTEEGNEPGGIGESNEFGGTGDGSSIENAGNITPVIPIVVGGDKEGEEKPQESSDAVAEESTEKEEVVPLPEPSSTPEPNTENTEKSNDIEETKIINKEIEIIDLNGKCLGEFDEIDLVNKIFYEDKSAKGLGIINPKTGKPSQTAQEFADKQIYTKTRNRINNLMQADGTRQAKTNIVDDVPSISDIQEIKKFVFRLDGDSTELRTAVENSIKKLQLEFPDYSFEATFGNHQ